VKVQLRQRPFLAMGHKGNGEGDSLKALPGSLIGL